MTKTVTGTIWGGLGNQLYIYMAIIWYSLKYNRYYYIPKKTVKEQKWPSYRIGNVNYGDLTTNSKTYYYKQPSHAFAEIPNVPNDIVVLDGYFQSYKYFEEFKEQAIKIFGFNHQPISEKIAIHVRRGDYITKGPAKFPVVTDNYLNSAIDYLNGKDVVNETTKFKFFSDDIAWCKEFVTRCNIPPDFFEFSEGQTPLQDMTEMSNCQHIITGNSSFSIWAAMLNQNANKIIVCPNEQDYFGPSKKDLDISTLYPTDWVRMRF